MWWSGLGRGRDQEKMVSGLGFLPRPRVNFLHFKLILRAVRVRCMRMLRILGESPLTVKRAT